MQKFEVIVITVIFHLSSLRYMTKLFLNISKDYVDQYGSKSDLPCIFNIVSRVRGSVTNNNGFWIGSIGAAITITLNYNHL
jgi:hypothetical protein